MHSYLEERKKSVIESGNKAINVDHLLEVLSYGQRNALKMTMNVKEHDLFP